MTQANERLRVFISYARKDGSAFAEELLAALEAAGFDAFLDREDISPGEPWEDRLRALLRQADTVVYVITPGSVASERCAWELERAEQLAKRVLPVIAQEAPDEQIPAGLRALHYVHFTRQPFGTALRELCAGLRTDLAWVREHTRLGDLAAYWDARGRPDALLLRGSALEAATRWLSTSGGGVVPTDLHRAFVQESERAEQLRTSDERKRLEELVQAQEERARAVRRAARANGLLTVVLLVGLGIGAARLWSYAQELRQRDAERALAVAEQQEVQTFEQEVLEGQVDALSRKLDQVAEPQQQQVEAPVAASRGPAAELAVDPIPWSVDIFWCEGPNGAAQLAKAQRLEALLTESPPFAVDRVRLRALTETINERADYDLRTDEVRAEASEQAHGARLVEYLAAHELPVGQRQSATRTPYYLSVFFCEGATGSARKGRY